VNQWIRVGIDVKVSMKTNVTARLAGHYGTSGRIGYPLIFNPPVSSCFAAL